MPTTSASVPFAISGDPRFPYAPSTFFIKSPGSCFLIHIAVMITPPVSFMISLLQNSTASTFPRPGDSTASTFPRPGWFFLRKNLQLSLLNPITHDVIDLPDFTGPPFPLGIPPFDAPDGELFFHNWDSDRYVMKTTKDFYVLKAILTSSPLEPSCLVFVHTTDIWELSFCKIGDDHWTVIEFEYHVPFEFHYINDFTFNSSNGCLYTISGVGAVTMYNLSTSSRVMLNCSVQFSKYMYLVDGSSPEVLLVAYYPKVPEYIVYKFSDGEKPKWIEVSDVGQNMLFVGGDRNTIVLPSSNLQLPGWGANCLCCESIVMKIHYQGQIFTSLFYHSIKLARLDDGKITAKIEDLGSFKYNKHCPKSLWLTPSLE